MNRALIRICKNGDCFGNMLVPFEFRVAQLMDKCMNILYNYNKNLYNCELPREILAIRLLQEASMDGTDIKNPADILYDSKSFIEGKFGSLYGLLPTFTDSRFGTIGIIRSDREYNDRDYDMCAMIDIGNKTIRFYKIGRCYFPDVYENEFNKSPSSLLGLGDIDAEYNSNESRFLLKNFNELDDFYWLIVKNPRGFVLPSGRVFMPYV